MATAIEQLEAMCRVGQNWDGYGGASPRPEAIVLAQAFVGFIEAAMRGGRLAARGDLARKSNPNWWRTYRVGRRPGGTHEADFAPDGSIGFLHLNKQTKQIEKSLWSSSGAPAVVSPGLLAELQHLLAA